MLETLISVTGWLNAILFSMILVPQMVKTLKIKNVDGVSIWVGIITIIANIDAFIYATLIKELPLQAKYTVGLFSGIAFIIIYIKNRKKK